GRYGGRGFRGGRGFGFRRFGRGFGGFLRGFFLGGGFLGLRLHALLRLGFRRGFLRRLVPFRELHHAFLRQEALDAVGRLGALLQPVLDALLVQDDALVAV